MLRTCPNITLTVERDVKHPTSEQLCRSCFTQIWDHKRSERVSHKSCCSCGCKCFGWELGRTTVIPCLGVSLLLFFASCNVSGTVLLEFLPIPPNTHTLLPLERPSIGCLLSISRYLVFSKTVILVYKFLQSDLSFLKPRNCVYNTHRSQEYSVVLQGPNLSPHQYLSLLLAFSPLALHVMLQRFGVIFLTMYFSATSLYLFSKKLETFHFAKAYPPWFLSYSRALTSAMCVAIYVCIMCLECVFKSVLLELKSVCHKLWLHFTI